MFAQLVRCVLQVSQTSFPKQNDVFLMFVVAKSDTFKTHKALVLDNFEFTFALHVNRILCVCLLHLCWELFSKRLGLFRLLVAQPSQDIQAWWTISVSL